MAQTKDQRIRIEGQSMLPTFYSGEFVNFSIEESAKLGDICLIRDTNSQELIVHRLVLEDPVTFKGDNSLNLEQGEQFKLLGVSLESRKKVNTYIASLSLYYSFKVNRFFRVLCKVMLRVLHFIS
jgi:signal peptidase I